MFGRPIFRPTKEPLLLQFQHWLGHPRKGPLVRFLAKRMRALAGLRESPKFFVIRLMGYVREALLDSGKELVEASRLEAAEDLFFLRFSELASERRLARERGHETTSLRARAASAPDSTRPDE